MVKRILISSLAIALFPALAFADGSGEFVSKRYNIQGSWEITEIEGQTAIRFSDDFKTKSGPDLKLFLSPAPVDEVTGRSVTDTARKIAVLASNKGEQTYILPDDVDLTEYQSLLIQCEAFSVLWGGFDIP